MTGSTDRAIPSVLGLPSDDDALTASRSGGLFMRSFSLVTALFVVAFVFGSVGCVADTDAHTLDDDLGEDFDPAVAEQAISAAPLEIVPIDTDIPTGNLGKRVARVLTDRVSMRALLGGSSPSVDFSRNALVAFRPASKTATSRIEITRAQLSGSGKTLSLWATVTEPGAGCAPWWPNELAVARVPSRAQKAESLRVYVARATYACGLVQSRACTLGGPSCPAVTPVCHGALDQENGVMAPGVCTRYPTYGGTSQSCKADAACGSDGICTGLATSQEGLCQPAWMRGTYSTPASGQLSAPLPQGGPWHRLVIRVTGQSTVPMDAWVQVLADGIDSARVEWRLSNSTGTTSTTVRGTPFGAHLPVNVPGDESINGEWTLEVRDIGAGSPGYLRGARLSLTSRWD